MPLTKESVLALPIRAFDKATRRIQFEMADGTRFDLIGGEDRRPLSPGVAGFSPWEVIQALRWGIPEPAFRQIALIKAKFGGGVEGLETYTGGTQT